MIIVNKLKSSVQQMPNWISGKRMFKCGECGGFDSKYSTSTLKFAKQN